MTEQPVAESIEVARQFLRENHRAVLVTRRGDGGLQTSPVTVGVDAAGHAIVSTIETSAKARNLTRDPRAVLTVVTDAWFGKWLQIEGTASLLRGPDAIEPLVEYYRGISGEHPDWDDYRRSMAADRRLLVRVAIERVVNA